MALDTKNKKGKTFNEDSVLFWEMGNQVQFLLFCRRALGLTGLLLPRVLQSLARGTLSCRGSFCLRGHHRGRAPKQQGHLRRPGRRGARHRTCAPEQPGGSAPLLQQGSSPVGSCQLTPLPFEAGLLFVKKESGRVSDKVLSPPMGTQDTPMLLWGATPNLQPVPLLQPLPAPLVPARHRAGVPRAAVRGTAPATLPAPCQSHRAQLVGRARREGSPLAPSPVPGRGNPPSCPHHVTDAPPPAGRRHDQL